MTATSSIRLVKEEDFDRITDIVTEAFLRDPVWSYFASLKEVSRRCKTPRSYSMDFQLDGLLTEEKKLANPHRP